MADYRRYQPRHSSGSSSRGRRLLTWGVVLVAVFFVGKAIFGRGESNPRHDRNENVDIAITLVNDNIDVNSDTNVTTNSNTNDNANSNSNTNSSTPSAVAGSETFGDTFSLDICKTPLSSFGKAKFIALTFDVSAGNDAAKKVLDILAQKKARASFFSTGVRAEKNKDFVASVAKAGFGVYSSSYESKNMSPLSADELVTQMTKAEIAITAATGESPKPLLRPPFGDYNSAVVKAAYDAGYCIILWTVDGFDWQDGITADAVKQRVLDKAQSGAIVVLHAGYDVTPDVLPSLIDTLRADGYTLVSLPTLLQQ